MMKEGADPNAILNKYLDPDEQGQIESWDQAPEPGMKVRPGVYIYKSVTAGYRWPSRSIWVLENRLVVSGSWRTDS